MNAPTLGGMAVGLAVCFLAFRGLERLRPRSRRTPLLRPGLATDIAYWFVTPLLAFYVVRVGPFSRSSLSSSSSTERWTRR